MQKVLILGAGGHAQVVANIVMSAREAGERLQPIGFLDDDVASHDKMLLGLPILGTIADLARINYDTLIVGIGENRIREGLFSQLLRQGERFATAVHPAAVIAPDVSIGPGTAVCAGVVVNPGSEIGANTILNTGCTVDHHNQIGDHAHIAPGVHLGGKVQIGEGALVGIGATVLPNRRIGPWSVVGGGALVVGDIPPAVVAYGVPAKFVRYTQREGNRQ